MDVNIQGAANSRSKAAAATESNGALLKKFAVGSLPDLCSSVPSAVPSFSTLSLQMASLIPPALSPLSLFTSLANQAALSTSTYSMSMVQPGVTNPLQPTFPTNMMHLRARSCRPLGRSEHHPNQLTKQDRETGYTKKIDNRHRLTDLENGDEIPLDLTVKTSNECQITASSPLRHSPESDMGRTQRISVALTTNHSTNLPSPQLVSSSTRHSAPESPTTKSAIRKRRKAVRRPLKLFDQLPQTAKNLEMDSGDKPITIIENSLSTDAPTEKTRESSASDVEGYHAISSPSNSLPSFSSHEPRSRRSHSACESRSPPKHTLAIDHKSVTCLSDVSSTEARDGKPSVRVRSVMDRHTSTGERTIYNPRMRRFPEMTPSEVKDEAYWEKRVKNNEAARRSRRARKTKEAGLKEYAEKLERANAKLTEEIELLKKEVCRLKSEVTS
ncbi:hypothetical protein EG68_07436 [Paragonimus skrjabini miyazakii]|uniref:BZIP domain-containing protein n=1 Tax=Paragonimus skrjabini miyazakii TaxID=59628 RepID=A0A8S9YSJ3_9TREM|nr:hypothetical protein EG68_07436 [Paragonimus skrjabini miyazakii]